MDLKLVPEWSREQLVCLALKLLKQFGHNPKEGDIRDNGYGLIVIFSDRTHDQVASIEMSKTGESGHILSIPALGKSRLVDEFLRDPWIGGLNRCFRCCMTYFKSAVREASLGRASMRPQDWLCGHPAFVASDQRDGGACGDWSESDDHLKIPFEDRLVDVLICLNCSRIHYLLFSLGYFFQVGGRDFRLENSGYDANHVARTYQHLAWCINDATRVLATNTLAAMVADYLLPRDGSFVVPVKEHSHSELTVIEGINRLTDESQVHLAHDGTVIFLDTSEYWGAKSGTSPIRLVKASCSGSDTPTVIAYSPHVSAGGQEPRTNFEIPIGELDEKGTIHWSSGPKYFERNPLPDDIKSAYIEEVMI